MLIVLLCVLGHVRFDLSTNYYVSTKVDTLSAAKIEVY